jgi:DNA-binding LacI/PurR family transcriptional regulator
MNCATHSNASASHPDVAGDLAYVNDRIGIVTLQGIRANRPTLTQVAAEAGVSPMTVSNAFNRPDQLSPSMRERVLETARRVGYSGPDPVARGLRSGRAGAIGVVYDTRLSYALRDPAAGAFLSGICERAEGDRLGLLIVPGTAPEDRDVNPVRGAIVDGFLIYSVATGDPLLAAVLDRGLPTVVVDQPRIRGTAFVGIDDRAAAAAAAGHALALGHRRLAALTFAQVPDGRSGIADAARQASATYPVTRARLAGYADAAAAVGVRWADVPVYECAGSSRDLGAAGAAALLECSPRPTALLATSDELALGALDAAHERGVRVPGELSVIGFDDTPAAAGARPPLTTVHQDHAEKGRGACALLLDRIRGAPQTKAQLLPHRLVARATTGRMSTTAA